jgi:hypothetical protein
MDTNTYTNTDTHTDTYMDTHTDTKIKTIAELNTELLALLGDDIAEFYTNYVGKGFCKTEIQHFFKEFIIVANQEPCCLERVSELQFSDTLIELNTLRQNLSNKEWLNNLKDYLLKNHNLYFNVDKYSEKRLKISMMHSVILN